MYFYFFFYFFFIRVSSYQIVNSVCWSHAMANGPHFEEAIFGWWSMNWAAVDDVVSCLFCSHSHAALSGSPHFFMDAFYRPTPVRSLFRVIQCVQLRSSPLRPSPGSDASHSCFHAAAIYASFDRSSGMTLSISWASLL